MIKLNIGDTSKNGQVTIVDEDRLCYLVKSNSRGAMGLRTISKALLQEFVTFIEQNPEVPTNEVRFKISGQSEIDKYEYGYGATIGTMAKMILGQEGIVKGVVKGLQNEVQPPLQQIFFGAPGTGKSHTVNETTKIQPEENVFRTTFHPDSDYSTFVGCYKPSMKRPEKIYTEKELTAKLKEIKESGVTYPCHKFATKYWESLKDRDTQSIKNILSACGFTDSMAVEVSKGVAIGQDLLNTSNDGKIVYDFSPQTFTKAYLRAWQTEEPVFLVIEEINRGNCAQIFGDLFQLLDRRDDGYSEYPIKADNDLAAFIGEQLSKEARENIPENVKSGEELMLPSNLYIWATMNTSDQSLFPIDSAFKRRWEWKYIPIDTQKESWCISVNGTNYDWSDFLEKINAKIESATSSEDKMLGFYFCRAENGVISAEKFVNKVLFYLWNDVFKDYGFDDAVFNDENNKKITFRMFYKANGNVDETITGKFMENLHVSGTSGIHDEDDAEKADGVSEKRLRFWEGFNEARGSHEEYSKIYTERKPLPDQWMDLAFGTSAYRPSLSVLFTKSVVRVLISIYGTNRSAEIFAHFKENESALNEIAGVNLDFKKSKTSYAIIAEKAININDESTWNEAYDWMMSMAIKMKSIKDRFGI